MFVRTKRRGKHIYLQIVENERVNGSIRQHVLHSLGRLDVLQATGRLDGLMVSLGRSSTRRGGFRPALCRAGGSVRRWCSTGSGGSWGSTACSRSSCTAASSSSTWNA